MPQKNVLWNNLKINVNISKTIDVNFYKSSCGPLLEALPQNLGTKYNNYHISEQFDTRAMDVDIGPEVQPIGSLIEGKEMY